MDDHRPFPDGLRLSPDRPGPWVDGRPDEPVPDRRRPALSPTETKVYRMLIQRLTEREVAERLDRSPNTVHVHVRNIYRKLGVCSRKELLALARKMTTAADQPPPAESRPAPVSVRRVSGE